MARIVIDSGGSALGIGSSANDGTGDPLRTGASKLKQWAADINTMTDELYDGEGVDVGLGIHISDTTENGTAINAALAAQGEVYLKPGTHTTTVQINVLGGQHLYGAGAASILQASSVSGAAIKLGNGGAIGDNERLGVEKLRIRGTATRGVDIDNIQEFFLRDVIIGGDYLGATLTDGLRTKRCWDGEISNITTKGSTISNAHYLFGEAFNNCDVEGLYTGGGVQLDTNIAFKIDGTDNSGTLPTSGSSFKTLIAQGVGKGLWVRSVDGGAVNGFYSEGCVEPIVFGDYGSAKAAKAFAVNAAVIYEITSSHPGYSDREAVVNFDEAFGCSVNGINLPGMAGLYDVVPITFTGGTPTTQALAVARMKFVAGDWVIHSVEVLYGGNYAGTPTPVAAGVSGETLVAHMSGTAIDYITVSNGGSGGVMTNLYPILAKYRFAVRCAIRNPTFYHGTTFTNHQWISPIYPLIVRSAAGGAGYEGVLLENDTSFRQAGLSYTGVDATMRKVFGTDTHAIHEYDSTGALYKTLYTPPVYP